MKKLSQKGFGSTGLILLIIVITALGGVGYRVYSNQQTKDTKTNQQSTTSDSFKADDSGASTTRLELTALGVAVSDPEKRGLKLNTSSYNDQNDTTHTIHYITLNDNKYQDQCGNPISIYPAEEVTAKAHKASDTSITYRQIDGKWYSTGVGERYSDTEYCKSGKSQDGYKAFVEDLMSYVSSNLTSL